jgi:hypothetical protein
MSNVLSAEGQDSVLQFPRRPESSGGQRQQEKNIEARLLRLSDSVKALCEEPYLKLLNDKDYAREALEELIVKETTLGWIVRVAKRSEQRARVRLWVHIEQALADLERLAGSLQELKPEGIIPTTPDPSPQ